MKQSNVVFPTVKTTVKNIIYISPIASEQKL